MSQKVLGTAVYPIEINDQITLPLINVLAGATATDEYDVDGVTIGDFVDVAVICPDAAPATAWVEPAAGITIDARVSVSSDPLATAAVAGKVRVSFTNTTGGPLNIPADSVLFVKVRVRDGRSLPTLP